MRDRSLATPRSGPPVDIGRLIDDGRWSAYQRWLVLLAALTIIFDGIDNQLLGLAIPSIMKDWRVARAAFSPVVSFGYLGMMAGGMLAGLAGDRVGRRTALLASMVIFGAMTMAASIAASVPVLACVRALAGVGLGGAMPNAAALVAESVPRRQRSFAVTLTIVCVPLGGMLAGLVAASFLTGVGWRGLFAIGGVVPVAVAALLLAALPESPKFLAARPRRWPELARTLGRMGRDVPADAAFVDSTEDDRPGHGSIAALFSRAYRRDTAALWGSFFFSLLAVYLVFSWLPALFAGTGLGALASTGITAFNLGGVVGAVAGGRSIAWLGSRAPILAMAGLSVAATLVMSGMTMGAGADATLVVAMLVVAGGAINATQTMMYALAAHVYPTSVRATGVGAAVAVGRIGAALSGYAGPWAIGRDGSVSFFALIAAAMAASFACLSMIRRHIGRPAASA